MNSWDVAGQVLGWIVVAVLAIIGLGVAGLLAALFWSIGKVIQEQIAAASHRRAEIRRITAPADDEETSTETSEQAS